MAEQVRIIRLTWENEVSFKMDTKLNDGSYLTILEMDENGCIHELWNGVQGICEKAFSRFITDIGTAMKA